MWCKTARVIRGRNQKFEGKSGSDAGNYARIRPRFGCFSAKWRPGAKQGFILGILPAAGAEMAVFAQNSGQKPKEAYFRAKCPKIRLFFCFA